ncbi:MAG TPA: NUDIX domain-containing protein [Candidatus Sulfotelmatobacter sp.]|jgi:8-oxo-dGTP diphosphatase|nr:NUDIX domain-containing protein [Candidatus Sulfotelmatobacter sp.]
MKARVIVAILVEKEKKILLGRKPDNVGPYPNTWHFPGGGVNLEDESVADAVKRELKEETSLEVAEMERVSFSEDYEPNKNGEMTHYVFLVYKVIPKTTDAKAADDIVKVQWFTKSEVKKLSLTRPSLTFFQEIGWL